MTRRVTVLMGGWSSEREVSLVSGAAVADGLRASGFAVTTVDVGPDPRLLIDRLDPRPDVVFNALHGRFGEDGCIQGLLDILGIPYTHSGVLASALAMNKAMAKQLFSEVSIPVAAHRVVSREEMAAGDPLPRPYVVKPVSEGSSVGVRIVRDDDEGVPVGIDSWPYGARVMVERFVPGRELTVAVMGDRPLAVTEITTKRGFYDYDAKYTSGARCTSFLLRSVVRCTTRHLSLPSARIECSVVAASPAPISVTTAMNCSFSKSTPSRG